MPFVHLPQPGFVSITLLQKFTPHFKILDPRLTGLQGTQLEASTIDLTRNLSHGLRFSKPANLCTQLTS